MRTAAIGGAVEAAAVLLFAVSGMITAARKQMDIVGTYCLAVVTAFGGGTLRDLLVDQRPFFWVVRWEYLVVIAVLCIGFVYSRAVHARIARWHRSAIAIDALGLALFTLTGLEAALHARMPVFVASLVGVITGTFGGVLRDVSAGEVPELFRPGSLNALSAFAGSWVVLGGGVLGLPSILSATLGFVTIVVLRLVSVRFGVRVPDPVWLERDARPGGGGRDSP
jgi:uncharacterized membrane protein YeiH